MTRHIHVLRLVSICLVIVWFVLIFMYGMASDRYEVLFLAGGSAFVAALTALFATFVYGPLSFPRGSSEALLSKLLLVLFAVGLLVVGSGLVRRLLP